ncbi:MAG TPA: class F sortase [Candidatus Saccharimonadales bacterium]|nr:class F sortase [Candidatus Saccharimonadales bacterium]
MALALNAWVSSRDEAQAISESGGGLGLPSLTPTPSGSATAVPSPSTNTPTVKATPKPSEPLAKPARPIRLLIPAIDVKAKVQRLGTLTDGSQQLPDNFTDVSWWKDGQMPGQAGNAVFAGHTYSKGAGVFDNLPRLAEGNRIIVVTTKGRQTYRVVSVGSVPRSDYASVADQITRRTGKSGVVLQTCGDWDGSEYHATSVVYATLT